MKKKLLAFLVGLGVLALPFVVDAAIFNSNQVGASPSGGYVLQTNGATSTWVATSSLGISGGGSSSTVINGITGPMFTFSIVGTSSPSTITTSSANLFLNLLQYSSSSNINVSATSGVISFTGILPSANGGTATTTALGSNAFSSVAFLPLTGGTLTGNLALGIYALTATKVGVNGGITSNGNYVLQLGTNGGYSNMTLNTDNSISLTVPLGTSSGGTATTTALGTAAFTAASSYLPAASSTYFPSVATTTISKYDITPTTTDKIAFVVSANPFTIKRVLCYEDNSGDTVTYQIIHGSTNVFSSSQTCTATMASPQILTSFSSASVAAGETVYLTISAASSSATTWQLEY